MTLKTLKDHLTCNKNMLKTIVNLKINSVELKSYFHFKHKTGRQPENHPDDC